MPTPRFSVPNPLEYKHRRGNFLFHYVSSETARLGPVPPAKYTNAKYTRHTTQNHTPALRPGYRSVRLDKLTLTEAGDKLFNANLREHLGTAGQWAPQQT